MNCPQAREILSFGFPSPMDEGMAEAQEHLHGCESCRSYLRQDAALRQRLRGLPAEKPSAQFKERLFMEISRVRWEQSRQIRKRKTRRLLSVAVVVLAVIVGWFGMVREADPLLPLVDYLVEDHQQNLPGRFMMTSSSRAEIESWFEGKLDFPLQVRTLEGGKILGARLCHVDDKRAALVFYGCRSHILSWFTFPQNTGQAPQGRPSVFAIRGYNLILWNEKGLVHAVVSDMDSQELLRMLPLS